MKTTMLQRPKYKVGDILVKYSYGDKGDLIREPVIVESIEIFKDVLNYNVSTLKGSTILGVLERYLERFWV